MKFYIIGMINGVESAFSETTEPPILGETIYINNKTWLINKVVGNLVYVIPLMLTEDL